MSFLRSAVARSKRLLHFFSFADRGVGPKSHNFKDQPRYPADWENVRQSGVLEKTASEKIHQKDKSKIYLIDDHPVMVRGVSQLINAEPTLHVVGSTADWTIALKQIPEIKPDLVILDITLTNGNGIEVLKNLRVHFPHLKVLMLSMHDENLFAIRSMKAGAHGYIMKESATEEVVSAIKQVLNGEVYLSPGMARQTMDHLVGRRTDGPVPRLQILSDREMEVFQLIGGALTTRAIAEKLFLSVKTIETHKSHIKEKLNLENGTELTQYAIQSRMS